MTFTATVTKLTTAKTSAEMRAILDSAKGKIYAEPHALGFEIRDLRPLAERFEKPIGGKGVVRYFGETHKIVTEKLLNKFAAVVVRA